MARTSGRGRRGLTHYAMRLLELIEEAAQAALGDSSRVAGSRIGTRVYTARASDERSVDSLTPQQYRSSQGDSCASQGGVHASTDQASTDHKSFPPRGSRRRQHELAQADLEALQAVADWIKTFVVKPHKDLGRAGTVCPFVPGSLEPKTLWLAPEQITDREMPEVVELMNAYKRLLLDTQPTDGDDVIYNVVVVVFSDLPADRAQRVFDDVLSHLAVPSYVEDGILFGPYYEGNEGTAVYNSSLRPFQSPVPFLFARHGVTGDWKFFLDDEKWLNLWARRYGESAVQARVHADFMSGVRSGVNGTPTFYVNGIRHDDSYDAATLLDALERVAAVG